MKKTRLLSLALLLSCTTMVSRAAIRNTDTSQTEIVYSKDAIKDRIANMTEVKTTGVEEMKKRVEEIKAMDKSTLAGKKRNP